MKRRQQQLENMLPFARRSGSRPSATEASSSPSILKESLRNAPFNRRSRSYEQASNKTGAGDERKELNSDLLVLSRMFPDVQFEVFRELLTRHHGHSRLQLAVNQLIAHKARWVKGRWQKPPRDSCEVPLESTFRSAGYKSAVQQWLSEEYRYLKKSTIEAVLAENNHSYTQARPTLANLQKRTWRATFEGLNIFKKKEADDGSPLQLVDLAKRPGAKINSGCGELDEEIDSLFLRPGRVSKEQHRQDQDIALAEELNEAEAREGDALYECGCCYSEYPFEKMVSCTSQGHLACQECVRKTVQEAIFGQGWARSVESASGSLKCLTPLPDGVCDGHISRAALEQAVVFQKSGAETWVKFEDRLFESCVANSRAALIRCPFCSYAEADPTDPNTDPRPLWRFRALTSTADILIFLVFVDLLPFLLIATFLLAFFNMTSVNHVFRTALHHLSLRDRSPRFCCQRPGCKRLSCLVCRKAWHDPHACHEPLLTSLRTAVEAARTAAVKRTCPRCGLSFVKASGCNKLTCVCGYSMCYLCRTGLGNPKAERRADDGMDSGYRHFCEHFRPNPGRPCPECNKCDLYKSEDETAIVRRAGEIAEREWRVKEGMVGVEGLGDLPGIVKHDNLFYMAIEGDWTMQDIVDWFVGRLIELEF